MEIFSDSLCFVGAIAKEQLWNIFAHLSKIIEKLGPQLPKSEYSEIAPKVWVHKSAHVAPSACVCGPTIICENAQVKHCAFVRGSVLLSQNATIGAFCEVKNSVLMSGATVAHLCYVGDSILGANSHFGAGVVASNLKLNQHPIKVVWQSKITNTNLRKFGALVGDNAQVGCNSVLCPGTILGKNTHVFPLRCIKGTFKQNTTITESNV